MNEKIEINFMEKWRYKIENKLLNYSSFLGIMMFFPVKGHALDTTEPFEIGFSDFEMSVGFGGIGLYKGNHSLEWEGTIGVGLIEKVSASFSYAMESNEYLDRSVDELGLELFFTALDSRNFDIDVYGGFGTGGCFGLGTELNLELNDFGLQLIVDEGIENQDGAADKLLFTTGIEPMAYYSINEEMQVLTALDFSISFNRPASERALDIGAVSLGFNIVLSDAIELLTEIGLDIPRESEKLSAGMAVRFIATLPGSAGK